MKQNNKFFLLALLMLMSTSILPAQTKESNYAKIGDYILRNYRPDSAALSKCCRRGCIFVKFRENQQNSVVDVSFAGDADSTKFITDALKISVDMLKRDARLIDFLRQSDRTIVQPFIYDYQAGCKFPMPGGKSDSNYYLSYIDILSDLQQSAYSSMLNMLKFNGNNMHFFDGILLEPIAVNYVILH